MFELLLGCLVINLGIAFSRFYKNPTGSLINPLFYFVIFSSLYLLLPALYVEYIMTVMNWSISDATLLKCKLLSLLYCVTFLVFYLKSKDTVVSIESNIVFSKYTIRIAKVLNVAICILLLFIIVVYLPKIFAVRSNRAEAFRLYSDLINNRFKLRVVLYSHICILSVLLLYSKKLKFLLPIIGYLIIDYSHGGRTVTFICFIFAYFFIVLLTGKKWLKAVFICIIFLAVAGVFQRTNVQQLQAGLYTSAAEFANTYCTTAYVCAHPDYSQNGMEYFIVSATKFLPGAMVDKLLSFGEWYGPQLSKDIGQGYGLAGNIITEALVYGGLWFAIINPFLIGGILYCINGMKAKRTLFGFLFVMILCASTQVILRQYFWAFLLYPLQLLWVYSFWLIPDFKTKVFKI